MFATELPYTKSFSERPFSITNSTGLPADTTAERIVRHFQAEGFPGITEAVLVRIRLKQGDRLEVGSAFDRALAHDATPPVHEYFQIQLHGFYSEIRGLLNIKTAFADDFTSGLRAELSSVYFDPAPVVVNDALANDTKYDAMSSPETRSATRIRWRWPPSSKRNKASLITESASGSPNHPMAGSRTYWDLAKPQVHASSACGD